MHERLLVKAEEFVARHTVQGGSAQLIPYCSLAMIDLDGGPTVSAVTAVKAEGLKWMTFCTGIGSNKVIRLKACSRASVCFCTENYNITLTGRLELLTDPATKQAMWYEPLSHHFSGPEDPMYCVLRFTTERYNLLVDWQEARGAL